MDESHKDNVEWMKPDSSMIYTAWFFIKFKNKLNRNQDEGEEWMDGDWKIGKGDF